jgi:hypothetical protein
VGCGECGDVVSANRTCSNAKRPDPRGSERLVCCDCVVTCRLEGQVRDGLFDGLGLLGRLLARVQEQHLVGPHDRLEALLAVLAILPRAGVPAADEAGITTPVPHQSNHTNSTRFTRSIDLCSTDYPAAALRLSCHWSIGLRCLLALVAHPAVCHFLDVPVVHLFVPFSSYGG